MVHIPDLYFFPAMVYHQKLDQLSLIQCDQQFTHISIINIDLSSADPSSQWVDIHPNIHLKHFLFMRLFHIVYHSHILNGQK